MSLKTLGKLFIGIGLLLLVFGLAMDTSVSTGYGRVVNIGLANDRFILVVIGGVVFIGGVVLFAVFKAKQTKEDEATEQAEADRKREERNAQVLETSRGISAKFAKDNLVWRLAHGLGIGFTVTTLADLIHPPLVLIVLTYLISVGLTCRAIKYSSAISQGWLLASLAILYVTVHSVIVVGQITLMIVLLPASAICLFVSRRFAKKTE
jgi:hypothetical protein